MQTLTFEDLAHADKIVVTTNLNRTLKTATDGETVRAVLGYLQTHTTGWAIPEDGVPVARLRLNFYAGDEFLGNVGADKNFFTAHQLGAFWSKPADKAEYDRLLAIIQMSPPD